MRYKLVLPFHPVWLPSAQLSLDGPERGGGGGGEGSCGALNGVTRDGEGVEGVVREFGCGRDSEGVARNSDPGVDLDEALLEGNGRVFRSGRNLLVEGEGDGLGDRDVDGVVGGVDRGDGQRR